MHGCVYDSMNVGEHNAWTNGWCVGSKPDGDDTTKHKKSSTNWNVCTTFCTSTCSNHNWSWEIRISFMFLLVNWQFYRRQTQHSTLRHLLRRNDKRFVVTWMPPRLLDVRLIGWQVVHDRQRRLFFFFRSKAHRGRDAAQQWYHADLG